MNQLLLSIDGKNVLIDTGLGDKWSPSQVGLLDFQQPRQLMKQLSSIGTNPEEIDIVIYTHLHYDHSGGGTRFTSRSLLAPTFTKALYYIQKKELEFALNPDLESVDDYKLADIEPLSRQNQVVIVDGDVDILPGLSVHLAPGHCPGHQVVLAQGGDETVFFPGDLFATPEHANLKVATAYDSDVDLLMITRKKWLEKAAKGKWTCVFSHAIKKTTGKILPASF